VPFLFGNPGSTELPLIDALSRRERPGYVLALHESAAIGMADGYAQQSGRLAAANVHVEPGLANAMAGVVNAARARVPMLVTVGQQQQDLLPTAPFLGGDIVGMALPAAKAAWEARDPAGLADLVRRGVRTALTPPRGPVVLSLPLDVQVAPAPAPHRPEPVPPTTRPLAPALDRAAEALRGASAPAVAFGDGVGDAGAAGELAAVAERLGAPLYGEPMPGRISVPTDHPLYRGPLPPFAAQIAPVLAAHDVVLACGMPVFRLFGGSPGPALGPQARLIHLDDDPQEIGRVHTPEVGVAGDLGASLAGLLERLGPASARERDRRSRVAVATGEARRQARDALARAASGEGVSPAAFARAVAAAVGPRDLVVDEALTAGRGLRTALGRRVRGTWLAHRGSALGWGLPAAVGAKLADPARRVMAIQGDGGLLFGVHALWTAAHHRLGLALVVADNRGYEILRAGLEGMTGRPEAPWPGLRIERPDLDLLEICRGFGASAVAVERSRDLRDALAELWLRAETGPAVLVVRVIGRTPAVGYPLS